MSEINSGRIRKRENPFSQVANHPLRNPDLSLKAKGLYAVIQSFINIPDFILYKTTLMNSCSEGKDAFESAWKELKKTGYLIQHRVSNGKGRFTYEYELMDIPEPNFNKQPHPEKPVPENPVTVNPYLEKPYTENQGGIRKNEASNIDIKYNEDYSFFPNFEEDSNRMNEKIHINSIQEEIRYNVSTKKFSYYDYVEFVKEQIDFDFLKNFAFYVRESQREQATMEWVYLMADLYVSQEKDIVIKESKFSMNIVKQKLLLIDKYQMMGIFENFSRLKNQQAIRNPRSYMIAALYNAHSQSGVTACSIEDKQLEFPE